VTSSPGTTAAPEPTAATVSSSATGYIGTITETLNGGGNLIIKYYLGTPETNPSSSDVSAGVSACNNVVSWNEDTAAYVPLTLDVSYTGALATTLTFGDPSGGGANGNYEPIGSNGNWTCYQDGLQIQHFSSGELAVLNAVLIFSDILSNNQPTFDPSDYPNWQVNGSEVSVPAGSSSSVTLSGPNACEEDNYIELFGHTC
jgi:hypothetical protein